MRAGGMVWNDAYGWVDPQTFFKPEPREMTDDDIRAFVKEMVKEHRDLFEALGPE
jgi:hypothetical protein